MIKHVLVPVDGSPLDDPALSVAFSLARPFGAHVEALHARWDPRQSAPLAGSGLTADMIAGILEESDRMLREAAENARSAFHRLASQAGAEQVERSRGGEVITAWWRELTGRPDRILVQEGRYADLIVLCQAPTNPSRVSFVETGLFETGRPLVLAAPNAVADGLRSVAVAWNGSPSSVRAVGAALPLLRIATTVTVLTVSEDGVGRSTMPGEAARLAEHLSWHGIDALVRPIERQGRSVGEALADGAAELGAGLLVMGGYGHTRIREMILGGVTRYMTNNAPGCSVFMVH